MEDLLHITKVSVSNISDMIFDRHTVLSILKNFILYTIYNIYVC